MVKHSIVILQDNAGLLDEIKETFMKSNEFEVVGASTDGSVGLRMLEQTKAEYVLMGLMLQGMDGLGVLDKINEERLMTKAVIFSSFIREEVIRTCINKGAVYYITKPCPSELLFKRVLELTLSESDTGAYFRDKGRTSPSLDEKISKIFISVGIPPHIKGYSYLREGVKLAVKNPDIINNITKKLYPMIGEKYDTSASKVERAIRHAIEVAWTRGRIDNINSLFGVRTYDASEKPTNGEFIALIADKMLLEGA